MNYKNLRWSIITLAVIGGLSACSSDESSSGTDGSAGAGGTMREAPSSTPPTAQT